MHDLTHEKLDLAANLIKLAIQRGIRIGLVESCTGGSIAQAITQISGASRVFVGSLVCYQNEAKQRILGVSSELLEKHSAVSEEVARAMWNGGISAMGVDLLLAVTGYAEPENEKLIVAHGFSGLTPQIETFRFRGSRTRVIEQATVRALEALVNRCLPGP